MHKYIMLPSLLIVTSKDPAAHLSSEVEVEVASSWTHRVRPQFLIPFTEVGLLELKRRKVELLNRRIRNLEVYVKNESREIIASVRSFRRAERGLRKLLREQT